MIKTIFFPVSAGEIRIKRSDEPVPAYEPGQIIEWSDFVGPVAGFDANFEMSARVSHRFLRRV